MRDYGDIDSKFRYVILASKRAKQLLAGAKPKIKSRSKNLIRVAQEEVMKGLIDFEVIHQKPEEVRDSGDDMFIGEELSNELENVKLRKPDEIKFDLDVEEEGSSDEEDKEDKVEPADDGKEAAEKEDKK